jgi:peptidoglycan/LPS O-acetylase OafA/YrhL
MLFYLVCSLVLLGRKWLLNKTVLAIGVVGLCALTVGPDLLYSGNELQKSAHMYLFFAVGLLVFLHREQLISRPWFSVLNGVVVAALVTRNVLWWKYWGVNYMTFAFPLALFIFYSIIFGRIIVRYSLLAWIGKISYSIYLTHIFVPHHAPLFSSVLLVRVAVWFALAFVVGWILFRSVETPAIQTGRRILKLLDRRAQARKAKKTVVATESA